jgi:type II secretory pathway pseudopilin PulG
MLRRKTYRSSGASITSLLVAIGVIVILMGITSSGWIWVKRQAEITTLSSRAHQVGTALQLFYQQNREFPDAYPAQLEDDLAPFIDNTDVFSSYADPDSTAELVNRHYVTPIGTGGDQYVISFNSVYDPEKTVVLFSNATTEVVERLPIECNEESTTSGSIVKGRTITFSDDTTVELVGETEVTIVQSYKAPDGTPIHIVKQDADEPGEIRVDASDEGGIVVIASENGPTSVRGGEAEITFSDEQDQVSVENTSAEVVVDGKLLPGEETESVSTGHQNLFGRININPNNSDDFDFILEKLDGTQITREDLWASNASLQFAGRATMIRVKPKGNGNQNTMSYNGEPYPLKNGRVYVITAAWMACQLYNDKDTGYKTKGPNGKAMGRWYIDNLIAFGAQIVEVGPGNSSNNNGNGNNNDDEPEDEEEEEEEATEIAGSRSLGRGSSVPTGSSRSFTKYN